MGQIIPIGKFAESTWLGQILKRAMDSVEFSKGRSNALLQRWTFNLNAAGQQTIVLAGNFIYGYSGTDTIANINVQFSRKDTDQDQHPVVEGFGYIHPFDRIHISWATQAGKTIEVLIGNLAPDLLNIIDNRSAIAQAALLQEIIDELQGDVAAEGYGRIAVGAAATQIRPALAARKSIFVQHSPAGVGVIYLGFDNTVTNANHFIELSPGAYWTADDYRGAVFAIRSAGATNAQFGEV